MPELDSMTVRGFKSIASVENVSLGAINIVIGPNGSGKSNFIGVFSFLHAIREGHLQDYVLRSGGADKVLHFGSKTTPELYIHISFQEGQNQYEIKLQPTDADELVPRSEMAYFWNKSKYPAGPYGQGLPRMGKEAGISDPKSEKIAGYVREHLDRWRLYHFHDTSSSSPMKKTADVNDNRYFRPDGSNLAAFLYYLKQRHGASYSLIRRTVQRVAPFFDDFLLGPQKLNPNKIRLEWRHKNSEAYFDASSLSDGTLRFIALATLFLQPNSYRPSVILVDEPELGLHPYAITMLASLAKQASADTQVILSTQSPLLLDHFRPGGCSPTARHRLRSPLIKRPLFYRANTLLREEPNQLPRTKLLKGRIKGRRGGRFQDPSATFPPKVRRSLKQCSKNTSAGVRKPKLLRARVLRACARGVAPRAPGAATGSVPDEARPWDGRRSRYRWSGTVIGDVPRFPPRPSEPNERGASREKEVTYSTGGISKSLQIFRAR